MKFVLDLPPTTNALYRNHGHVRYMTREAKAWKSDAQWTYKTTYREDVIEEPVRVIANFYLKRDRDVDNLKILLDSLEGMIIKNDSQVVELHIMKHKDKDNPRVELVVETLI